MKLIYTQFEVYDPEMDEVVATVSMIDEGGAKVEVTAIQTASSWRELAKLVEQALKQMQLKGDME